MAQYAVSEADTIRQLVNLKQKQSHKNAFCCVVTRTQLLYKHHNCILVVGIRSCFVPPLQIDRHVVILLQSVIALIHHHSLGAQIVCACQQRNEAREHGREDDSKHAGAVLRKSGVGIEHDHAGSIVGSCIAQYDGRRTKTNKH